MKRENANYLIVGLFVVSMFLLIIGVMYRLAVNKSDTDTYYILFQNITGIKVGTRVTYSGYRIGSVTDIKASDKSGETEVAKIRGDLWFKVRIQIKKDWKIPAKSKARIVTPNLIADQQIDIKSVKSERNLNPGAGSLIYGQSEQGIHDIARSVVEERVKPILEKLEGFLDDENRNNIKILLSNFSSASKDIKKLSKKVDMLIKKNERKLTRSMDNLQQASENFKIFSHKIRVKPRSLIWGKPPKEIGKTKKIKLINKENIYSQHQ